MHFHQWLWYFYFVFLFLSFLSSLQIYRSNLSSIFCFQSSSPPSLFLIISWTPLYVSLTLLTSLINTIYGQNSMFSLRLRCRSNLIHNRTFREVTHKTLSRSNNGSSSKWSTGAQLPGSRRRFSLKLTTILLYMVNLFDVKVCFLYYVRCRSPRWTSMPELSRKRDEYFNLYT